MKTDNAEAAKTGAYKLADAMGRTGDILLLVHDSKSETAKERTEAFCAEIQRKISGCERGGDPLCGSV